MTRPKNIKLEFNKTFRNRVQVEHESKSKTTNSVAHITKCLDKEFRIKHEQSDVKDQSHNYLEKHDFKFMAVVFED